MSLRTLDTLPGASANLVLSSLQYHWTDGYGSYRHSKDPSYQPRQTESGDWQILQPAR